MANSQNHEFTIEAIANLVSSSGIPAMQSLVGVLKRRNGDHHESVLNGDAGSPSLLYRLQSPIGLARCA